MDAWLPDYLAPYISPLDAAALLWFLLSWFGYTQYAERIRHRKVNLLSVMDLYRLGWMQAMLRRENRMMDSAMVGNLLRSIAFFASTTIFILLGLMTLLGYYDRASAIIQLIPFATPSTPFMWEVKVILLILVFIYAFYKYTWSMRLYNYTGILVSAAPAYDENRERHQEYAEKAAKIVGNAAKHFNNGMRAYYFGLAVLAWFLHPWVFILATTWVVLVTYRREFRSYSLNSLVHG